MVGGLKSIVSTYIRSTCVSEEPVIFGANINGLASNARHNNISTSRLPKVLRVVELAQKASVLESICETVKSQCGLQVD